MKLSIAWIFDHIDADWKKYDIAALVDLFNQKTAEIEGFYKINLDLQMLFIGRIIDQAEEIVQLEIPETNETIELPKREDIILDGWFIIKKKDGIYHWATGKDFYNDKDGLLPAVTCQEDECTGEWKQHVESQDYILEVDNKSITHRPDMWGHRGFAREVAILLDLKLKPIEQLIAQLSIKKYMIESKPDDNQPFSMRIHQPEYIKRFAIAYFEHIDSKPSLPWMLSRLCKVDVRPIDALVDMTNYVMLDLGQPVHAFDADKIITNRLEPRLAQKKETLMLLDDELIELDEEDIVITDGQKPLALGGIMGGKETGINADTTSMVLESANFDAITVRKTAARHKKRTEASSRFEKSLDPNQNVTAIERFVRLLKDAHIGFTVSDIYSIGPEAKACRLLIKHGYIQEHLGVTISPERVLDILASLGFSVKPEDEGNNGLMYHVTVPTFRCTKDVQIKEDILEEIGRLFGYMNIPFVLPKKQTIPSDLHPVYRTRHIKRLLAFGFNMHELHNYAFFDEEFLRQLAYKPTDSISVLNPVSENWQRLVTTLMPNLLKAIWQNHADHDELQFFEWGRIWFQDTERLYEQSQLAGVVYHKKEPVSFYDVKGQLQHLFAMIDLSVHYKRIDVPEEPWFTPYQSAQLYHDNRLIGKMGIVDLGFTHHLFPGHACAFVLDGDFIRSYKAPVLMLKPLTKYPVIDRDISMIVPVSLEVEMIINMIKNCSPLIRTVQLIDFFAKEQWHDKKSLTFRFSLQDETKTLTKHEADVVWDMVAKAMKKQGAEIR